MDHRLRSSLWALLLAAAPAAAQVDIGVQGGVPLTHFVLDQAAGSRFGFSRVTSAPRRYTLGPFVNIAVGGPVVIETGVLYKRFGFDTLSGSGAFTGPFITVASSTTGNSWEFPILAKLRLRWQRSQRGFLTAGPVIRHLTGMHESGIRTVRTTFPPPERIDTAHFETDSPPGMNRRTSAGVAIGAGVDFEAGPLLFQPGVRLTRWDTERTASVPSASRLGRTQTEFLLAVGYSAGRRSQRGAARIPGCFEPGLLIGLAFSGRTRLEAALSSTTYVRPAHRLAAGGFLDWRFHRRLSLEGSFLARRLGQDETSAFPGITVGQSLSGYAWEAPLLLKWRPWKPVAVGTGPALRRASHLEWVSTTNGRSAPQDASWLGRTALGWAVSAGVEIRAGGARLRPELRYQWFNRPLYQLGPANTRQESVVLLVGFSPATRY